MLVTSSSTVDATSLIATTSLSKGGDNEYNGRQVICATPTGSIVAGEESWISVFDSVTKDATVSPAFSASITSGDIFEMWRIFTYEEVNEAINEAIMEVTDDCLQIKEVHNIYTASGGYEYNVLSGFKALYKVEYVASVGTEHQIDACESGWIIHSSQPVEAVTRSFDTSLFKEGSASMKLVMAANAAADILIFKAITLLDISDCDELEVWVYSTVALSAGDLQVLLDDTAACASPVESLNIPATTANTWTRHVISLANPQSDSAIISVGIKQVVDKGAFTLYLDDIRAVKSGSRRYLPLNPEFWNIAKGATPYLKLDSDGLSVTGNPTQLRLTGYKIPVLLNADATASEIDPAWIIARVTGRLLVSHAKSSRLDIVDRAGLSKYWLGEAESRLSHIRTRLLSPLRWVS